MKKSVYLLAICTFSIFSLASRASITFTTIDDPLGVKGTTADGVDGNQVCGYYIDSNGLWHGFIYQESTYATFDDPSAAIDTIPGDPNGTEPRSISGGTIVGTYSGSDQLTHGFIYNVNAGTFTTVDNPLSVAANKGDALAALSGNTYVGIYGDSKGYHSFKYNGTTFTTLTPPSGVNKNAADGISGGIIVGYYFANSRNHGYVYNGSTFTTLDDPNAVLDNVVTGISGNNIVGAYEDANSIYHGFLYDGSNFTTIDDPLGTRGTLLYGVSGNTVVGAYLDNTGTRHGFIAAVPEPSALPAITLAGALMLRRSSRPEEMPPPVCS